MTDSASEPRIVNVADDDWSGTNEEGGRWKRLGRQAGGTRLGCTLEDIEPGGRPARYHYHLANEEAMYVLDGDGTLRTPGGETAIEAGDYVSFPVGASGAHAVENTSDDRLTVLFSSTMREPDVCVYPDDGELFVSAGTGSGWFGEERSLASTFPIDEDVAPDGE